MADRTTSLSWTRRQRLRLWHRLLTPGWIRQTPAARLRGWARVLRAERAATAAQRWRLLEQAFWWPLRTWREAGDTVARLGGAVAEVSGVSPAAQRRQIWWLGMRHGLSPASYVEYQLYRPERRRHAAAFVQEPEHTRVLRWMHRLDGDRDAAIFRDKVGFSAWCVEHGFPSVPTLLVLDEGRIVSSTLPGDPVRTLPACDLFSKPNAATSGHGVERWIHVGTADRPRWRGSDGRERSAAELLDELAELSLTLELREGRTSRRMLLQPCLRNHRDLAPLTTGALSTVRVLVYRPPGGASTAVRGAFRLAVGGAAADNYASGGIVAPVDVRTGVLQAAARREDGVLRPIERHPDTGAVIAGVTLPFWRATIELCERGLEAAPGMPTIGWDVAITDDGPVLVEGNMAPNPGLVQKTSGQPLSDTPLPDAIDAYVRSRLGI